MARINGSVWRKRDDESVMKMTWRGEGGKSNENKRQQYGFWQPNGAINDAYGRLRKQPDANGGGNRETASKGVKQISRKHRDNDKQQAAMERNGSGENSNVKIGAHCNPVGVGEEGWRHRRQPG